MTARPQTHITTVRNISWMLAAVLVLGLFAAPAAWAGEHKIGVGVHYWRALDDLEDDGFDIDEDGLAGLLSYQYLPGGLLRFEIDIEYFPDGFAGAQDEAFGPIVFLLVGGSLYGGVGVGITYSDELEGDFSDPYYAARVGFNLSILPGLDLDINANYRADAFNDLDEASSDAITLGAMLRFSI